LPARGSLLSPDHLIPGTAPVSSRRLQAPAEHLRLVLNHAVEHGSSGRSAIISGFQLSAIFTKPSAGNAAAATNPHRRSSVHRFPAGSFFQGFRTPALYRIDSSCSGRHPKPFRIADLRWPRAEWLTRADSGHAKTMAPEDLLRRISVGGLP